MKITGASDATAFVLCATSKPLCPGMRTSVTNILTFFLHFSSMSANASDESENECTGQPAFSRAFLAIATISFHRSPSG
jgi:hypothetical protein